MEVRDQPVDDPEAISGQDEKPGFAPTCAKSCAPQVSRARSVVVPDPRSRGRLCCARCEWSRPLPAARYTIRCASRGWTRLRYGRAGRSCTHVEGHVSECNAARSQRIEHVCVEVQPGCRRGHRARRSRVDSLMPALVLHVGRMLDIRRQRHRPVSLEHIEHVGIIELQAERPPCLATTVALTRSCNVSVSALVGACVARAGSEPALDPLPAHARPALPPGRRSFCVR